MRRAIHWEKSAMDEKKSNLCDMQGSPSLQELMQKAESAANSVPLMYRSAVLSGIGPLLEVTRQLVADAQEARYQAERVKQVFREMLAMSEAVRDARKVEGLEHALRAVL
jgi:hypothetical protein